MKNIIIRYLLIFTLLFVWSACSSSTPEVKKVNPQEKESPIYDNNLRINTKQIYCWVNKMPGEKARFNITGELVFFDDSDYDINNITIKKILIIQNNNVLYQLTPKLESTFVNNSKSILFSTVKGMLVSIQLDSEKSIDVKVILSDNNNEIEYFIKKVKIEEAY
ncbi:MAG: hypothetical protein KKE09_05310 [Bacteroidetes bacterium]|nr:hypothetical protein [Bacteroidota bacterium]